MNNSVLYGDVFWHNIINYLSPIDLYNLVQTCKYYEQNINMQHVKNNTIKQLNNKLSNIFGPKLPEFKNILQDVNGIISGSCILQSILGEKWEKSDIDIFIPVRGNVITNTPSDNPKSEMDDFMFANGKMTDYDAANRYYSNICGRIIVWCRTYKINNQLVQVILINVENRINKMCDFIFKNFDFDICKNIYHRENNNDNIVIHNIKDVLTKQTTFKIGTRFGSSVLRCEKYMKRGFTFINPENSQVLNKNNPIHITKIETCFRENYETYEMCNITNTLSGYVPSNDMKTLYENQNLIKIPSNVIKDYAKELRIKIQLS